MNEVITSTMKAFCGLNCSTCAIYMATRESDPARRSEKREEIAATIRAEYGKDFSAEQVTDCDGCRSDTGRLFSGCSECQVRECAKARKVDSCAFCPDYACDKLRALMLLESHGANGLDGMADPL